MREIKFRGWNGKEMLSDILKAVRTPEQLFQGIPIPAYCTFSWSMSSIQEIMQFTGLHDVNGVEIYEGDIVSLWYAPRATAVGFISFENGGFVFNTEKATPKKEFVGTCVDCGNAFTVIGNIYQTPELLK